MSAFDDRATAAMPSEQLAIALRSLHGILLAATVTIMSTASCDSAQTIPFQEALAQDLDHATEVVQALTREIAPDLPWQGGGDRQHPCVDEDGKAAAYQSTYSLQLTSAQSDLDDEAASESARSWLTENGFEFRRDARHEGGLREIWAIKEDDVIGIGVVVDAHPGGFRVKATTQCRP